MFVSRVIIRVRFNSIIVTEYNSEKGYTFWSLENGIFNLKLLDQSSQFANILSKLDDRLPRLEFWYKIRTEGELIQAWRSGRLSSAEFLLRLNAMRGRSFIDLDSYPVFPDFSVDDGSQLTFPSRAELIYRMAAMNPFAMFDRNSRRMRRGSSFRSEVTVAPAPTFDAVVQPADVYFHSLHPGDSLVMPITLRRTLENERRFPDWISRAFSVQLGSEPRMPFLLFGYYELEYVPQPLAYTIPDSLIFNNKLIMCNRGLQQLLDDDVMLYFDPVELTVSLQRIRTSEILRCHFDATFAFVSNMAVGEYGIFFVLDFIIGFSVSCRLEYQTAMITFHEIARFDVDLSPVSCVSDMNALVATYSESVLTLWHLLSGIVHRRLKFDAMITAAAFDCRFDCLFVATVDRMVYLNVNGEILCEISLNIVVTALSCPVLPMGHHKRCVVCGTKDGEILLMSPVFESKGMVTRKLDSPHRARVRDFVIPRSRNGMISLDGNGVGVLWTATGVRATKLKPSVVVKCAVCENKPAVACPKCNRILCEHCAKDHSRCLVLADG
jgi:hypothetical protein